MDNNFSIGNRIRELRNQKHLSQEQLALSAEITTHLQTSGPAKPPKTNLLKF